ncbi:hypothetical protein EJV47_18875 [Hymenobacter gummosus]|uniref:Uncharacterized protein n=1 Tax=Hymenobacter gummosus TaxID=1776032 RepID=A0A3S0H4E8_9BACT|nr:hypothetical protein [Hymenobacter gummosus]RTQ47489.1 hypothetical protein EJV47_18875 [Hymenobacter gummosus]
MTKGLFIGLLLAVAGCHPGPAEPTEAQRAAQMRRRVLALHDSTMLHMDALTRERQRLEKLLTQLDTTDARHRARLRRLHGALVAADTTMTHWMRTYQEPDTALLSPHQYVDFWTTEEAELRALARQMGRALDSAATVGP